MTRNTLRSPSPKFSTSLEAKLASPKCTQVNFKDEILGYKYFVSNRLIIVAEAGSSSTEKTTRRAVNKSFYILYSVCVFPLSFVFAMILQNKQAYIFPRHYILEKGSSYLREAREWSSMKRNWEFWDKFHSRNKTSRDFFMCRPVVFQVSARSPKVRPLYDVIYSHSFVCSYYPIINRG